MQLTRQFHFDAAHRLADYGDGHPNTRIHGHSFRVQVSLEGQAQDESGQIMDLDAFGAILEQTRARLDHHMLNEIDGLEKPTLEHLCLWLWQNLQPHLPLLSAVEIFRDSLGQSCRYEGDGHEK